MSKRSIVILTEGRSEPTAGKTAAGILRYRTDEVVALIDSTLAGKFAGEFFGVGEKVPIVASLSETLKWQPDVLVIGITPAGGQLPLEWRPIVLEALANRLEVVSGMHTFLNDDPEFVAQAQKFQAKLTDLRQVPDDLTVNGCQAQTQSCFRVHTVGTDCNVGKKIVALELTNAFQQKGKDAAFVATGQTGVFLAGQGIAMDRVIGDFIAGAAERLILENAHHDYLFIEGQGAISHPLYSGVTLGMLHGFAPQALILVHQFGREIMRGSKDTPVLPPEKLIPLYEAVAAPVFPAKVVGIALNLRFLDDAAAQREVEKVEKVTGLPTTDVIKFGAGKLVAAVLEFEKKWRKNHP